MRNPQVSGGARRFGPLAKLVTFGLFLGAPLLLFELFLRASGLVTDMPYYFFDPGTGPRIAPHQSGRYIRGEVVRGRYHYNAQGWNHPEDYVLAKSPGRTRVALLDSMVQAHQVDVQDTMFVVAQRAMTAAGRPTQWYVSPGTGRPRSTRSSAATRSSTSRTWWC